ncbi:hypothetical protein ScPMuIL_013946 [Solemya velum]
MDNVAPPTVYVTPQIVKDPHTTSGQTDGQTDGQTNGHMHRCHLMGHILFFSSFPLRITDTPEPATLPNSLSPRHQKNKMFRLVCFAVIVAVAMASYYGGGYGVGGFGGGGFGGGGFGGGGFGGGGFGGHGFGGFRGGFGGFRGGFGGFRGGFGGFRGGFGGGGFGGGFGGKGYY